MHSSPIAKESKLPQVSVLKCVSQDFKNGGHSKSFMYRSRAEHGSNILSQNHWGVWIMFGVFSIWTQIWPKNWVHKNNSTLLSIHCYTRPHPSVGLFQCAVSSLWTTSTVKYTNQNNHQQIHLTIHLKKIQKKTFQPPPPNFNQDICHICSSYSPLLPQLPPKNKNQAKIIN